MFRALASISLNLQAHWEYLTYTYVGTGKREISIVLTFVAEAEIRPAQRAGQARCDLAVGC